MESNEKKENKFLKILKTLGIYLKNVFTDFITSFKYNNMKLAGLLVCVPGIFLGFFLSFHAPVVSQISYKMSDTQYYMNISFDPTGILLFLLMLFGILNIFMGTAMISSKNLGSVVKATITSSLLVICGVAYLVLLFIFVNGVNTGAISVTNQNIVDSNFITSVVSVIISIVCSIVGLILGYIHYDRTYEKVDR